MARNRISQARMPRFIHETPRTVNRCRILRRLKGLSIGDAARGTGMLVSDIVGIEECDAEFEACNKEMLAEFYGVTERWLSGS